jgi:hypothetical protein
MDARAVGRCATRRFQRDLRSCLEDCPDALADESWQSWDAFDELISMFALDRSEVAASINGRTQPFTCFEPRRPDSSPLHARPISGQQSPILEEDVQIEWRDVPDEPHRKSELLGQRRYGPRVGIPWNPGPTCDHPIRWKAVQIIVDPVEQRALGDE